MCTASPEDRFGDWMISCKGRRLFPLDMRTEEIDIEEIAHALSNICRFGGHCKEFYSVAQHSIIVYSLVKDQLDWECSSDSKTALTALLHDATEAYIGDMVRPLKQNFPEFQAIEDNVWSAIASKFGLPFKIPEIVSIEDARVLLMEKRDLLTHHEHEWKFPQCAYPNLIIPDWSITPIPPKVAEEQFLYLFGELTNEQR